MKNIIINNFVRYRKAILTWIIAWALMSLLMLSMYNSMADSFEFTEEFLAAFPEAMREAFSIDTDSFATPEGFIATELLTLYVVGAGIFISNHIVNLQDENSVLIPLLRPIGKAKIALSNLLFIVIETFLINAMFVGSAIIAQRLFVGSDINFEFYHAAMMGANIVTITSASIVMFITNFANRSVSMGISMMYPILSLIIDGVSAFDGVPESLKYFSLFYYFNLRSISRDHTLDWERIPYLLIVILVTSVLGILLFRKKDIDL